ncbi:MAG: sulfatase [Fibrobacteres bacterium]|nr:sulfatase [Fibrobacterota bacterium]
METLYSLNRIISLITFAAVIVFAIPLPVFCAGAKPNVLFIMIDDLRPQLGCYGFSQMKTPNIDALAKKGAIFTNNFCQAPICGASRASLLTGIRPTKFRYIDYDTEADKEAPGVTDLPRHFKENGYRTVSIGKIFHFQFDRASSWDVNIRPNNFENQYVDEDNNKQKTATGKSVPYEAGTAPDSQYFDWKVSENAIAQLKRSKSKPFFMAVGFSKPHLPYNCPKRFWDKYSDSDLKPATNHFLPINAPKQAYHFSEELREQYVNIPKGESPLGDSLEKKLMHGYYACVSFADEMVGRVLAELDKQNLRENTIIVLWGDHGYQLGEHDMWCKHTLLTTSLRTPLIMSSQKIKPGTKIDKITEVLDIYPTLCELSGINTPAHLDGISMTSLIKEPNIAWKKGAISRYYRGASIRTDKYLYAEWRRKIDDVFTARMLCDLSKDPDENRNVAEDPAYSETVKNLSDLLSSDFDDFSITGK